MFALAAAAFLFAGLQYIQASDIQSAAQKRMAFIMTTIEKSSLARPDKKELYATITNGLPTAPGLFRIDFSGSYASPLGDDACQNPGQRSVCRALLDAHAEASVVSNICGACSPR